MKENSHKLEFFSLPYLLGYIVAVEGTLDTASIEYVDQSQLSQ